MNHWFTRREAAIVKRWVKRFDPLDWTVDFPRGAMASAVTSDDGHGLDIRAEYLRNGDLVGLIYESEDRHAHPAHARETSRDYSGVVLSFRWASSSAMPLDAVNGPTLTIEGRDADGNARAWYVRLWNYAQGSPQDAVVTLDFEVLDGGFVHPGEADRVNPSDIDRMFISIVPPDFENGSAEHRAVPAQVNVTLSEIRCDGRGSVLARNDAVVPEHKLRIATAYDDLYHLPPERVIDSVERLGYREVMNHYVGMSHYFALGGDGLLDAGKTFNAPAREWHRDFARAVAERGYRLIWSLSYELLDAFCPPEWKQRTFAGEAARTGWEPPSALVSPANTDAIGFLGRVAVELAQMSVEAGLEPLVQIGEPWWWVTPAGELCLYDDAARLEFGGALVAINDVRAPMSGAQIALLDRSGEVLAESTASIVASVKMAVPEAKALLLAYLPSVLDESAPELRRANLPLGWARPAFDVLQLEDYEWVTAGRSAQRAAAYALAGERLGYPVSEQHYLSGFVLNAAERAQWDDIVRAAEEAQDRGVAETFIWALPQVLRDGLTIFGEKAVTEFDDVSFPIEVGAEASVAPTFSTAVVTSASGHESRNVNWQQARLRFDAGPGVRGESELQTLLAFFRARRGAAVAFRFRDPYDFSSNGMTDTATAVDQSIGIGDGVTTRFNLIKDYGGGEQRRITRPVAGTVSVAIDGSEQVTGWTLGALGEVEFAVPPTAGASITAGYWFDVPVRFAEDRLEVNRATFLAGEAPSVPLIEVRDA